MANARVRNPPGSPLPSNTNLTRGSWGHQIIRGLSSGTDAGLKPCRLCNIGADGVVALHATTVIPDGVIIFREDYDWGTTTPSLSATIPNSIEIDVLVRGACLVGMDVSKVIDAASFGAHVYESDVAGLCAIAANAAPTTIGEASHLAIGKLLDLLAGNTGTGTGGADGDLAEVWFEPNGGLASTA